MLKGIYYNPTQKNKIVVKGSYKLIPLALREFGCFKLDCHNEFMPYEIYTGENVSMRACRIQDAIDVLKTEGDKQQFLDNIEKWDCVLGEGMFVLFKYSSIHCKMDRKVLMAGYEVFKSWMLEHTGLDVDNFTTVQSMEPTFMLKSGCYQRVYQISGVLQQFITKCVVGG